MIILHVGEGNGELVLWGETSKDNKANPAKTQQKTSKRNPRPYPFGATAEEISCALEETAFDFKSVPSQDDKMLVWLPTNGANPIPSSEIIAEMPESKTKTKIAPWMINVRKLSMSEAIDLLCASMDKRTIAAGVIVSVDLAYWTDVLRFAGSIVARQQYLPSLITDEGNEHAALWTPVFVGNDFKRLDELSRHMPAVGRALSDIGTTTPSQKPSIVVLEQVITAMTDYLVRTTASENRPPQSRRRKRFDSIHDSWLYALRTPKAVINKGHKGLLQLVTHVNEWQWPITASARSNFRLCFRLEAPDYDDDDAIKGANTAGNTWYIRYLIQPHDDQSLLIPADTVWNAKNKKTILERSGSNVKEFLLLSLGQASGICPSISTSLMDSNLAGHAVDTDKAYEFLTREAAVLEQAGYGIILPSWWTNAKQRTHLTVHANVKNPKMKAKSGLTLETLVEFNWEIAMGKQKMTIKELEELASIKSPLTMIRGKWVEVSHKEIQTAIKFLKEGANKTTLGDVIQMNMGLEGGGAPSYELDFEGVKSTGWIADVLNQLDGTTEFKNLKQPDKFSGTLRPYQIKGYSWLSFLQQWGLGGCLADDMGLGKTVQILALVYQSWQKSKRQPTLIVCPTSVINNWQKEAARFTPELPVLVHHGMDRSHGASFKKAAKKHAIVLSSYGLIQRDIEFLKKMSWNGVILDEAQNIKNPETRQARAARLLKANYRFALTGTPVENNVGDLWSIMDFLNPGLLGTQTEFKRNFFTPIQTQQDHDAVKQLKRATGPFILRRLKTDKSVISDLPKKMEMKVFCSLTAEQTTLYTSITKEIEAALDSVEGIQRKGMILSALSKLKQVCNHPAQFLKDNSSIANRSGKLARLTEMLEEVVESGDRALIFSQFAEMGHMLKQHMQEMFGQEVLFLHGGVPRGKRDKMVERFQNDDEDGPQIFILSLKAGGTGLNLTAANHVFHFDRWWNPAVENQATDRAFRIGQKQNVQVHKFVCAGTLEEKIDEMIELKKQVAEKVVGTGEGWLTELSDDDLRDILTLNKEEVVGA